MDCLHFHHPPVKKSNGAGDHNEGHQRLRKPGAAIGPVDVKGQKDKPEDPIDEGIHLHDTEHCEGDEHHGQTVKLIGFGHELVLEWLRGVDGELGGPRFLLAG